MATASSSTSSVPHASRRSVVHATFRIERTYPASPAQVYHALTDPAAKAQWFGGGSGFTELARSMDVRAGGRERLQGRWDRGTHPPASGEAAQPASVVSTFEAVYFDVVPNERLVYAYEMHLDQRKISVSLATLELKRAGAATRLLLTEQGAFLDGYDDGGARERGSGQLLDALGRALEQP